MARSRVARARVVGLGLTVVDHVYRVDRLDIADERTRYTDRVVSVGGMVAAALVQASLLGCRAQLVSVVGADDDGRRVRRALRAAGVDTRGLVLSEAVPTTVAVVLVRRRDGARRFVVPFRRGIERRAPALDLSPIRRGSVLLVDGHFPAQAARAVRIAAERGVPVVGDFHRPTPEVLRLLPHVDHPVVPEEFARAFTPERPADTLWRLREEFGARPVLTLGARGGLYLDGYRLRRFHTPRARVRDTTGAGDAFHGAFAAGLAQGLPLERNLARAAACGARCCERLGGVSPRLAGAR
jgi:sulfofructose kinase